MFYYQTDFDFSASTKKWILNFFSQRFNKNFDHDAEYSSLAHICKLTPINRELRSFLLKFNVKIEYAGINVFIANPITKVKTNPHIDVLHQKGQLLPIKSRFNVLVLGNPEDPMSWWNSMKWGDPNHKKSIFHYNGIPYSSLGIPGETILERLNFLSVPTETKNNLLLPSAFVNTEYAHALELSPQPRLIISVAINKSIEEIF